MRRQATRLTPVLRNGLVVETSSSSSSSLIRVSHLNMIPSSSTSAPLLLSTPKKRFQATQTSRKSDGESPADIVHRTRPNYSNQSDNLANPAQIVHEVSKNVEATMDPFQGQKGSGTRTPSQPGSVEAGGYPKPAPQGKVSDLSNSTADLASKATAADAAASIGGNFAKEGMAKASDFVREAKAKGDNFRHTVKETASDATSTMNNAARQGMDKTSEAVGDMKQGAYEMKENVKNQASNAASSMGSTAREGMNKVSDKAQHAKENIKEYASEGIEKAGEVVRDWKKGGSATSSTIGAAASNVAHNIKDTAQSAMHRAGDAFKSTSVGEKVGQMAHNANENLKHAAHNVTDPVKATAHRVGEKIEETVPKEVRKYPNEVWLPMSASAVLVGLMIWWGYIYFAPGQAPGIENHVAASQNREGAKKLIESAKPEKQ